MFVVAVMLKLKNKYVTSDNKNTSINNINRKY